MDVARETLREFYIRNDVRYYRSRPQLYAYTWDMDELDLPPSDTVSYTIRFGEQSRTISISDSSFC